MLFLFFGKAQYISQAAQAISGIERSWLLEACVGGLNSLCYATALLHGLIGFHQACDVFLQKPTVPARCGHCYRAEKAAGGIVCSFIKSSFMHNGKVWVLVRGDIFQEGLSMHLRQWGFEVVTEPFERKEARLEGEQEPAMIIMDYSTSPSGREAALLTSRHTVPILFLVAHPEAIKVLPAHVQVVNYYCLPKPCPIADLQGAVENLLGIAVARPEPTEAPVASFSLPLPKASAVKAT